MGARQQNPLAHGRGGSSRGRARCSLALPPQCRRRSHRHRPLGRIMSTLSLTQHATLRMSQRGIRLDDLELAEFIGTEVEGGCLVTRKDVQSFERVLKKLA